MIGTEIDCTAQVVELFVEQKSMPSRQFVARGALALKNDLIVKSLVPVSKARLVCAIPGSATDTLLTTCVEIVPSFLSSFCGRAVLMSSGIFGSSVASLASPPAPAPGLPPEG